MGESLEDKPLEFTCPRCGTKAIKTLGWLQANESVICAGCGNTIHLEADRSSVRALRDSLKELRGEFE
jgi:transcription elongation factor Elf1